MSTYHAQDSLIYDVLNVGAFSVIVKSSRTFVSTFGGDGGGG